MATPFTHFLNTDTAYREFKALANSPFFIDKSLMLSMLFPMFDTSDRYVCLTRPRRFGKSSMANMLGAFLSLSHDSSDLFNTLNISKTHTYRLHLNTHHIFHIDIKNLLADITDYHDFHGKFQRYLLEDLQLAFPDVAFQEKDSISDNFRRVMLQHDIRFVFIIDEWDAIFNMPSITQDDICTYTQFLNTLLKDRPYVEFAYMTGVLPIAKYSSGSDLNMFVEYTLSTPGPFNSFFGFTEAEVDRLFEVYQTITPSPQLTREKLQFWYDGYLTPDGTHLYNPRSVTLALRDNVLRSYWTESGPVNELYEVLSHNLPQLNDDVAMLLQGKGCEADICEYTVASRRLETRQDIFSAMVVYGLLAFDGQEVKIPNHELMLKYISTVMEYKDFNYLNKLSNASKRILKATLDTDTQTLETALEQIHDTEIPILNYNDENSLASVVNLAFLYARNTYRIEREDRSGKGFVDFIFYPEANANAIGIILELKFDDTPQNALKQIEDKHYLQNFLPDMAGRQRYTGPVLAVGIAYDKKTKKHSCQMKFLR